MGISDEDTQRLPGSGLPEPGYSELFGVPVSTLDRLRELRADAEALRVPLSAWHAGYAALLAGVSLPSDEQLEQLREKVADRWIRTFEGTHGDGDRDDLRRLLEHLALLEGPPTLTGVRERLDDLPQAREWARTQGPDLRESTMLRVAQHERYLRAWLHQLDPDAPDPVPLDLETGLPQHAVERHRRLDDDVLGRVPVGAREARLRAYADATEDQRRQAATERESRGLQPFEDPLQVRLLQEAMPREVIVRFLRFAHAHESATGLAMRRLWDDGALRGLLEEYLNTD